MIRHLALTLLALVALTGARPMQKPPCDSIENEGAMVAAIPGTRWTGCDGDCKWVARENNRFKCVRDTCPRDCNCRVFSRPARNWDGDWKDEGDWSEDAKEKDAARRYRCWCVKPAA